MTTSQIHTLWEKNQFLRRIEGMEPPFSVTVSTGAKRSIEQNRTQRLWVQEIAEQLPQHSAEYWRGYGKLHIGVPILRNTDEEFCAIYDEIIRPLPYEDKIRLMMVPIDLPVTSRMNVKQKSEFLDAFYTHFTEQGVVLTIPKQREDAA